MYMKYRTEELFGEGYRDAAKVIAHEIFNLQNSDIPERLSKGILKDTPAGEKLKTLCSVMDGNESNEEMEDLLDEAFADEQTGIAFAETILAAIKETTGKDIRYVLWLCDSIEDILYEYENENIDQKLTSFDAYAESDIVLSNIGRGGKLYGYEENPVPVVREIQQKPGALQHVDIDSLKPGDMVGYCRFVSIGWGQYFRYPVIEPHTIKRISPKRKKFILDSGAELTALDATHLVVYNEDAKRQSETAEMFQELERVEYAVESAKKKGTYLIERKLSDEELAAYYTMMKSFREKYLPE